jgi:hypothetical protein
MASGLGGMHSVVLIDTERMGTAVLFVAVAVYTLRVLGHSPTSTALALEIATDAERGQYMAVFQTSWSLAPLLFTALIALDPAPSSRRCA